MENPLLHSNDLIIIYDHEHYEMNPATTSQLSGWRFNSSNICILFRKQLQHQTPPTGLHNSLIDTAAVSCVVKHEACSNGRRISKQTRPSCRDRCSHGESGLTCNWSKGFTHSTRRNRRQDRGSPRRPTAGDQLLLKSVTGFISMMRTDIQLVMKDWRDKYFKFASTGLMQPQLSQFLHFTTVLQ